MPRSSNIKLDPTTVFMASMAGIVPPPPGSSVDLAIKEINNEVHGAVVAAATYRLDLVIRLHGVKPLAMRIRDPDLSDRVRGALAGNDKNELRQVLLDHVVSAMRVRLHLAPNPSPSDHLPPSLALQYGKPNSGSRESVARANAAVDSLLDFFALYITSELKRGLLPPLTRRIANAVAGFFDRS